MHKKFSRLPNTNLTLLAAFVATVVTASLSAGELPLRHPPIKIEVVATNGTSFVAPSDLLAAYNAPANLNGSGQTIAIIMDGNCNASDLDAYYASIGASNKAATTFTSVNIDGGASSSASDATSAHTEATMDVENASGMAPGAKIRLYVIPTLTFGEIQSACKQILADAKSYNITVVSLSAAGDEVNYNATTLQGYSATFQQLAGAGISILVASGDTGSQTSTTPSKLSVAYPASDPWVTGVGGTDMALATGTYANQGETGWTINTTLGGEAFLTASGGGYSTIFSKPTWQADGGSILSTATMRCVPDISAPSVFSVTVGGLPSTLNMLEVLDGKAVGAAGTSLACPLWAGMAAVINQARSNASLPPVGLLGPALYPLHGTNSITDITADYDGYSNGTYYAGVGYDLVTGLGTPNLSAICTALLSYNVVAPPSITTQPAGASVNVGVGFTLSVTATGSNLTYQWYQGSTAIGGATSASYSKSATTSDSGSYTVVVSNSAGSVTSTAVTVTVTQPTPTTTTSSSGGGGGGGAPSIYFIFALLALVAAQRVSPNRQENASETN